MESEVLKIWELNKGKTKSQAGRIKLIGSIERISDVTVEAKNVPYYIDKIWEKIKNSSADTKKYIKDFCLLCDILMRTKARYLIQPYAIEIKNIRKHQRSLRNI